VGLYGDAAQWHLLVADRQVSGRSHLGLYSSRRGSDHLDCFANAVTPVQIWIGLVALSFLSCVSYSAVYLLVGVISPKRAMVFCVMYTGFVEVVLGLFQLW
jgi:hypothetical protein